MPDELSHAPNIAFARDLQRLREESGITLEELHEETKIPIGLLRQFEETGLFDHPMFNRVYLRSLVRTYAERIHLDTDVALDALEGALTGSYRGGELESGGKVEAAPAPATLEIVEAGAESEEEAGSDDVDEDRAETGEIPGQDAVGESVESPGSQPIVQTVVRTPSWDEQSPAPVAERVVPVDVRKQASYTQWGLIAVSVVVLVAAIWIVLRLTTQVNTAPTQQERSMAADTVAADTVAAVQETAPGVVLGDTMHVVIWAVNGPVEGVRITRDDDLRRPYWIEQGDYRMFPALRQLVVAFPDRSVESVDRAFGRIDVLVDGYPIPLSPRDEQGRLVVSRDRAQAVLDTVTTEPIVFPEL